MGVQELILDANVLVAASVAFAAGVVGFASPCVVPLVPGYLSYMTGLSAAELQTEGGGARGRVAAGGLLFTLGFAVPFTLLGAVGGALSHALATRPWQIGLGLLVMALGVLFSGLLPFDVLQTERRVRSAAVDRGLLGALPLGFVFGVGWVPCIGPALTAVFALGAATGGGSPARGAVLALVYSLGLGLPFVLIGLVLHRAVGALAFLRRNARVLQAAGGALIFLVGLALATGLWDAFILWLRPLITGFEPAI